MGSRAFLWSEIGSIIIAVEQRTSKGDDGRRWISAIQVEAKDPMGGYGRSLETDDKGGGRNAQGVRRWANHCVDPHPYVLLRLLYDQWRFRGALQGVVYGFRHHCRRSPLLVIFYYQAKLLTNQLYSNAYCVYKGITTLSCLQKIATNLLSLQNFARSKRPGPDQEMFCRVG